MWPSQTPEKSGTPSPVLPTGCDWAALASAFGPVCAHSPAESRIVPTATTARSMECFRIPANPPVVRKALELLLTGLGRRAEWNFLAVGPGNFPQIHHLQAVFGGQAGHRDLITRLQFFPIPTVMNKVVRRRHFHGPFGDRALVILHFQGDERVWLN